MRPPIGNDESFGRFSFNGTIPAGQSVTRTQSITLPVTLSGQRWVVVTTDVAGVIAETDERNTAIDEQPVQVVLAPVPNLVVDTVTAPPTASSGQKTLVEWRVKNIGTGPTNAAGWFDHVYLSTDATLDATDTFLGKALNASYLNPNESYPSSLEVTPPPMGRRATTSLLSRPTPKTTSLS